MMLILAYHPELVAHVVRVLFSNQCSMNSRYFILSAMESAADFLYKGCPNNNVIFFNLLFMKRFYTISNY